MENFFQDFRIFVTSSNMAWGTKDGNLGSFKNICFIYHSKGNFMLIKCSFEPMSENELEKSYTPSKSVINYWRQSFGQGWRRKHEKSCFFVRKWSYLFVGLIIFDAVFWKWSFRLWANFWYDFWGIKNIFTQKSDRILQKWHRVKGFRLLSKLLFYRDKRKIWPWGTKWSLSSMLVDFIEKTPC